MPKIFIDFKPAEVKINSEVYVSYHVLNPATNVMERKRVRCNHIHGKTERIKYARLLCARINQKLYDGWNPFLEVSEKAGSTTFEQAVAFFIAEKKKELRQDSMRSYESYSKTILKFAKKRKIKLLLAFDCDAALLLMNQVSGKSSGKTYNNYLIFFRSLFNFFITNRLIKENPFASIRGRRTSPKKRQIIPPETRKLIADYFIETGQVEYLYLMQLCYRCFIRPKEILMLKIGDIDFAENIINIRSEVSKNRQEDSIGVPDEIMQYLRTLEGKNKNHYIFSTGYKPGKTMLTSRDSGRTWGVMRKKLGLPMQYQFYSLKDTGITEMLESGVPAKFVRDLARHSSLEITEKYVHKSSAKKILELNKLEF